MARQEARPIGLNNKQIARASRRGRTDMTIGIIGYGRFGKLLHQHLKSQAKIKIYKKQTKKDSLKSCDLVILAVPINEIENVCKEIKNKISQKTIVMDTCSVKTKPAANLKKYLKNNIVGTHPLFGPDSAKKSFKNHKMVVCPLKINKKDLNNKIIKPFKKLGVEIIISTPAEHDKMMARSQALLHFMGRGLTGVVKKQKISTPGYEDLLHMTDKVWNDTWELFFDMQNQNPYAKRERKKFINNIINLEGKIYDRQQRPKKN